MKFDVAFRTPTYAPQSYCVDLNCVKKSAVVSMAEDAYANYVLQTALDILKEGPIRERLLQMLLPCLPELVRFVLGRVEFIISWHQFVAVA